MHTNNDDTAKQYYVDTKDDIVAILRILATENVPLTVFYEGHQKFVMTHIVAVEAELEEVVLDAGSDMRLADAVCAADTLEIQAYQKQIKIQFKTWRASQTLFQNRPALRIHLPAALVGLERRENYRAKTDELVAATLLLSLADQPEPLQSRVVDISSGGCSFEMTGNKQNFDPGTVLRECILDMPGVGKLCIAVEIRHSLDFKDGMGESMRRFGCRFLHLGSEAGTLLRSYIHQIDTH